MRIAPRKSVDAHLANVPSMDVVDMKWSISSREAELWKPQLRGSCCTRGKRVFRVDGIQNVRSMIAPSQKDEAACPTLSKDLIEMKWQISPRTAELERSTRQGICRPIPVRYHTSPGSRHSERRYREM